MMTAPCCRQDTIAALQALVEYAKMDTNRALYNVEVVVEATSMGNWSHSVRLDSSNWPDQQEVDVRHTLVLVAVCRSVRAVDTCSRSMYM